MSGIIPNGVVSLRVSSDDSTPVVFRFPSRVKVTGIGFAADATTIGPGETWVLGVTKYRLAADYATSGQTPSVDFFVGLDNPMLVFDNTNCLSVVSAPAERGTWGDDNVYDIAQMDSDEWLAFTYWRYVPSGGMPSGTATISIAYTGATNID